MDFDQLYHFIFETYEGIGISILVFLVVCSLLAFLLERRTRKKFRDRPKGEDDIDFLDDDDEDQEGGGSADGKAGASR